MLKRTNMWKRNKNPVQIRQWLKVRRNIGLLQLCYLLSTTFASSPQWVNDPTIVNPSIPCTVLAELKQEIPDTNHKEIWLVSLDSLQKKHFSVLNERDSQAFQLNFEFCCDFSLMFLLSFGFLLVILEDLLLKLRLVQCKSNSECKMNAGESEFP